MVYLDGEKMSKSLGNMIFVDDVLKTHSADALRLSILSHPYRDEFTPSTEELDEAEQVVMRVREVLGIQPTGTGTPFDGAESRAHFLAALEDDFDTHGAITAVGDLAGAIMAASESGRDVRPAQAALRELTSVLGLTVSA
jgi:L-cysteine:1D-myo-inositol 2-amino-2-deoxy-alpha-D-glucopyranoside ligase